MSYKMDQEDWRFLNANLFVLWLMGGLLVGAYSMTGALIYAGSGIYMGVLCTLDERKRRGVSKVPSDKR